MMLLSIMRGLHEAHNNVQSQNKKIPQICNTGSHKLARHIGTGSAKWKSATAIHYFMENKYAQNSDGFLILLV